MATFVPARNPWSSAIFPGALWRLALLQVPAALLLAVSLRTPQENSLILWFGTAFQAVVGVLTFLSRRSWQPTMAPTIITLYLTALSWLWFGDRLDDWTNHFAKAVLVVIPIIVFGHHALTESGALLLRRANLLAQRLANRKEWPADLAGCRSLPEVKALRGVLVYDAAPALILLHHPRPEVRVAALAALEFRKDWQPGQAELVLHLAQNAEQPAVRAAAVMALGNVEDRLLIETLAQLLHDHSREVRKAAMEALLWDCERRWGWIRYAVRRILADPLFTADGPFLPDGQLLSPEAVNDLTGWCAEKGILSARAAQTLGAHFNRTLSERPDPDVIAALKSLLADVHTPAIYRLELGRLLQFHQELDAPLLERLVTAANPGSLRLIACEAILGDYAEKASLRSLAVSALRDLARLTNREIALATADIVQRRLGVDLGMGLGQPLPPVHSRQAADITRRVMHWANQYDDEAELERSGVPNR
jgi:HEAT repeats